MRGAQCVTVYMHVMRRIIPAYAGSTIYANAVYDMGADHPRVCGEHTSHRP